MTPFYDLLNTSLHVPGESDTALDLFKGGYETEEYKAGSKYTRPDFVEFAKRLEIKEIRYNKILNEIISKTDEVKELVSRSFLNDELKELYLQSYFDKLARISFELIQQLIIINLSGGKSAPKNYNQPIDELVKI
ncbi:MAG: hypothetical protein U5K00_03340 [Melioribacteraceae bacterium]|nr:hypothetical protein [Melioribacteraceae bacterium]